MYAILPQIPDEIRARKKARTLVNAHPQLTLYQDPQQAARMFSAQRLAHRQVPVLQSLLPEKMIGHNMKPETRKRKREMSPIPEMYNKASGKKFKKMSKTHTRRRRRYGTIRK